MECVTESLDALAKAAKPHYGLIPSLLDRHSAKMLQDLPPPIAGQRNADRSHLGSNLIHDEATLKTFYGLATALNRPDYAAAADACLRRFAGHCTRTATGLFPWGEHSYWHLAEDRVGNSYNDAAGWNKPSAVHDHLRQVPLWLWEKLWELNPHSVERFAEGLDLHWQEGRREYIRHALIDRRDPYGMSERSCDFPRHSGFYIFDWSFAWEKTARPVFLEQIRRMLDYWWPRRDARGLLLFETRSNLQGDAPDANVAGQTLSLATSLLESAKILEVKEPALAGLMRNRASAYLDGFFHAPHDLGNGVFVLTSTLSTNAVKTAMPVWGSKYGTWPASYVALTCLCAWRLTGDPRLLDWAETVGRAYLRTPFPGDQAVPAMDSGLAVGLLADLYDITDRAEWIDGALTLADSLVPIYLDAPLPRGASGIDWYESQMGPGFLLHGLARTALLAQNRARCPLGPDYTAR
jgi:hypothetical protein